MKHTAQDPIDALPASRDQAIDEGELFYYTGIPCRHGHVAKRYTTSGTCYECIRLRHQEKAKAIKAARQRKLERQSQQRVVEAA